MWLSPKKATDFTSSSGNHFKTIHFLRIQSNGVKDNLLQKELFLTEMPFLLKYSIVFLIEILLEDQENE